MRLTSSVTAYALPVSPEGEAKERSFGHPASPLALPPTKSEDPWGSLLRILDPPRCRVLLYILFGLNCHAHPLGIGLVLFCSYDLKVFWRTDYLLLFSFGMYYSSRLLNLS